MVPSHAALSLAEIDRLLSRPPLVRPNGGGSVTLLAADPMPDLWWAA